MTAPLTQLQWPLDLRYLAISCVVFLENLRKKSFADRVNQGAVKIPYTYKAFSSQEVILRAATPQGETLH